MRPDARCDMHELLDIAQLPAPSTTAWASNSQPTQSIFITKIHSLYMSPAVCTVCYCYL